MPRTMTIQGSPILLDELLAKVFGPVTARALLVPTFELNPGLAAHGPVLPLGVTILLPDAPPATETTLRVVDLFE